MKLYILGNITDMSTKAIQDYKKAKEELTKAGYCCKIATRYMSALPEARLNEKRAAQSIREMLTYDEVDGHRKYDGVALLDGWENDAKTVTHVNVCRALGIPCEHYREWTKQTDGLAYVVEVKETLIRRYIVRAENAYEAERKVADAYSSNDIVLDADDYATTEFSTEHAVSSDLGLYPKFMS